MTIELGRQGREWRKLLSLFGAIFLGTILLIAALGKVVDPVVFVEQIRSEGLEGLLSANSIALLALALETGLGLALILGVRWIWLLVPTSVMVAFFIFLTGRTYYLVLTGQKENTYDCGCFGVFLQRTAPQAFWQDLFLLVPALVLAYLSREALLRRPEGWKLGVAAAGAAAIIFYTLLVPGLPPAGDDSGLQMELGSENAFQMTDEFQVYVNGEWDEDAEVWDSQASLRLLIVSPQISPPLILNIRTNGVHRVDASVLRQLDDRTLELFTSREAPRVGEFTVGTGGIQFTFEGDEIELRPTGNL